MRNSVNSGDQRRITSNFDNFDYLIEKARAQKKITVIVGLDLNTTPEGYLSSAGKIAQRASIKNLQDDLLARFSPDDVRVVAKYSYIPFIALEVNENALEVLKSSSLVSNIAEEKGVKMTLAESVPLIGGTTAWNSGYTGQNKVVAILDTGVDKSHPFLANKVVSEACYSKLTTGDLQLGGMFNLCGGPTARTDVDSGIPCDPDVWEVNNTGCAHGTHVAGIAAGNGASSGVAKDAKLISIMVSSLFVIRDGAEVRDSDVIAFDPQIIQGLERVLYLKNNTALDITSVNLSQGLGLYNEPCGGGGAMEAAILNLKSVAIATVISSGNGNSTSGISWPGCVEPAVTVGATTDGSTRQGQPLVPADQIWVFNSTTGTNSADFLDLLAPGAWITSSYPGSGYETWSGTSMAAPHVAGAWAVIKQRFPNASVDEVLNALKKSGLAITDTRAGAGSRVKSRINIPAAMNYLDLHKSKLKFDFNGDGKTDISVFRPGSGTWFLRKPDGSYNSSSFGLSTDKLVPADFTGDGSTDVAVWRPSDGNWYILRSEDNSFYSVPFGTTGDIPAPGDFDGDGKADPAVYRPSQNNSPGNWYIQNSGSGGTTITAFGAAEDKPVIGDYDGDRKDDIAVFRPSVSQWWIILSHNNSTTSAQFGTTGDKTVQGDFTGDGKTDVAVYRPSNGTWYVLRSEDQSFYSVPFGTGADLPVVGDYDGDGKSDPAVFRPSENNWYVSGSASGFQVTGFGVAGDAPVPNAFSVP